MSAKSGWMVLCVVILSGAARGQFAPEDTVRLKREEPLLIKKNVMRQGRAGEVFTVLGYDAAAGRIFVKATGSDGKPFALNLSDQAVEFVPRDYVASLTAGVDALRLGNLAGAREHFVKAAAADRSRKVAVDLAAHCEALARSGAQITTARQAMVKIQPEIERQRRNAQVANRPNPLFNDNSNQVRAAEMMRKVEELEESHRDAVRTGEATYRTALAQFAESAHELLGGGSLSLAASVFDALEAQANQYLKGERGWRVLTQSDRAELGARVAISTDALKQARAAFEAHRLAGAAREVVRGLTAEPGRGELLQLRDEILAHGERVNTALALALALQGQKKFDEALAEVAKVESLSTDHARLQQLAAELRRIVREREGEMARAKTSEATGDPRTALAIYDRYGLEAEAGRVLPAAAKVAEDGGDFLLAFELYDRAGAAAECRRIAPQKEIQVAEYRKAGVAAAEARFADALAIYDRYRDTAARRGVLLRQAARAEAAQKFEEALAFYRDAQENAEVERLNDYLEHRPQWIAEGRALEKAASFDRAIELFTKANAREDLARAAAAYAQRLEKQKDYPTAAEYFELAGRHEDAGRLRDAHPELDAPSRRPLAAEEIFRRCAPACVTVKTESGSGSGFLVQRGGYLLTNNHVIEGAQKVEIEMPGGRTVAARVIGRTETPDLALLKADITQHAVLKLGDAKNLNAGAAVYAIGSPQGLPQSFSNGIVSHPDREFHGNRCVQMNVLINHGSSGGPLLDGHGQVVGVNTFVMGTYALDRGGRGIGSDIQGINYAVQIGEARALLAKAGVP